MGPTTFRGWVMTAGMAVVSAALAGSCAGPDPDALARDFVGMLAAGRYDEAVGRCTTAVQAAMGADQLAGLWEGFEKAGPYGGTGTIRPLSVPEYEIRLVPCRFGERVVDLKLVVDVSGLVAGLFVLPGEDSAYADAVIDVDLALESSGFTLPGTLALPRGPGPFPAVVLVHGSGPHDRDESLGPNAPFRDLAALLAARGVASYRYVKRTMAYGERAFAGGPTIGEETVDDAVAAVALVSGRPEIDPCRVFILGHSLGAMMLPMIVSGTEAAGCVGLAAPSSALHELVPRQMEYLAGLDGEVTEEESAAVAAARAAADLVASGAVTADTPASSLPLGLPASYWLSLDGYDPTTAAAALSEPFLLLQGGRDYQVPPMELEPWLAALGARAESRVYPELNHLFMRGDGPPDPAEYLVPGRVDERVADDIAAWIAGATR